MFIGHLPAGYLLSKFIQNRTKTAKYLTLGLIGSILPDIDILYFYFIDNRQTLHHEYWIHIPFYWIVIGLISFSILALFKKRDYVIASIIFFSNVLMHLVLDTIVGKIEWLFPFSTKAYYLFEVPTVFDFWVYNFIFHWTFLFEVIIIVSAIHLLIKSTNSQVQPK